MKRQASLGMGGAGLWADTEDEFTLLDTKVLRQV